MTEQKPPAEKPFITTDYRDIFGYENIVELDISVSFIERLMDNGIAYVQAGTEHQAKQILIEQIVKTARKIGVKEVGRLAIEELSRQRESGDG